MLMCRVMVILWALVYAWNAAKRFRATTRQFVIENGSIVYDISCPLFFGLADGFWELFDLGNNPTIVIKDLVGTRIDDQLAFQAILDVAAKYHGVENRVMLRRLSSDCHRLLLRSGQLIIDSDDDPDYKLAVFTLVFLAENTEVSMPKA